MLSNITCTNHTGSHHRRQSTPNLSAATQPTLWASIPQADVHQRGQSLDQGFFPLIKEEPEETRAGDARDIHRQQDRRQSLQEAQQAAAGPGHPTVLQQVHHSDYSFSHHSSAEFSLSQPCISNDDLNAFLKELGARDNLSENTVSNVPTTWMNPSNSIQLVETKDIHTQLADCHPQRRPSVPLSGQPAQRDLATLYQSTNWIPPDRRCAPPTQNVTGVSPVANGAMHFPYRLHRESAPLSRTADSSPNRRNPNLSIDASQSMRRGRSHQESQSLWKRQDSNHVDLSAPKTAPIMRQCTDFADMPAPKFLDLSELQEEIHLDSGYAMRDQSPRADHLPSSVTSFQSSPELPQMTLFGSEEVDQAVRDAKLSYLEASGSVMDLCNPSPPSHPNWEQIDSPDKGLEVDECFEETGITHEEIASFISGPFPEENQWKCLFEEEPGMVCGKWFKRKENVKSHVQTHLGDRQFVCKACSRRFVRQHDLKRHLKIHTKDKPYKCACGKDFHRQDALTRHRQRGSCVGSLEGFSPKKIGKRGRPRKARATTEERLEKAAKTRQYVLERTFPGSTYASSISGSSEYSHGSPPAFDTASVATTSPSLSHRAFPEISLLNERFQLTTPPISPAGSPSKVHSSPHSQHSYTPRGSSQSPPPHMCSIAEDYNGLPTILPHPNTEVCNSSPPELDPSSSSPATSNFFDLLGNPDEPASVAAGEARDGHSNLSFLGHDFPPFDGEIKAASGNTDFGDFLNLSDLVNSSSDKQRHTTALDDPMIGHTSFADDFMGESDDLFGSP